jgi:hypothetical protein
VIGSQLGHDASGIALGPLRRALVEDRHAADFSPRPVLLSRVATFWRKSLGRELFI